MRELYKFVAVKVGWAMAALVAMGITTKGGNRCIYFVSSLNKTVFYSYVICISFEFGVWTISKFSQVCLII